MLELISWKTYLLAILILVVIYYLIIGAIYYRKNVTDFIKKRGPKHVEDKEEQEDHFSSFNRLENVVKDIRQDILEKAGKTAGKEELLSKLGDRLANYDGLHQPAFRTALNNYIIQHAQSICGLDFSKEELEAEWERL